MILDAFINFYPAELAARMHNDPRLQAVRQLFGDSPADGQGMSVEDVLQRMTTGGVDRAITTGGLLGDGLFGGSDSGADEANANGEWILRTCEEHPDRLRAALTVDLIPSIGRVCRRIEEVAKHPMLVAIRVVPLYHQEAINSRLYYPIYERCEALNLPVTINVGIPGPRVRGACQQPIFLDDVMIDFPDLVVVAAHMGNPWEDVLVRLMMKYENLHLATSAYSPKYIDEKVLRFMNSSRGIGKVCFGTDFPLLDFARAVNEVHGLPLTPEARDAYLGLNAAKVFSWG